MMSKCMACGEEYEFVGQHRPGHPQEKCIENLRRAANVFAEVLRVNEIRRRALEKQRDQLYTTGLKQWDDLISDSETADLVNDDFIEALRATEKAMEDEGD